MTIQPLNIIWLPGVKFSLTWEREGRDETPPCWRVTTQPQAVRLHGATPNTHPGKKWVSKKEQKPQTRVHTQKTNSMLSCCHYFSCNSLLTPHTTRKGTPDQRKMKGEKRREPMQTIFSCWPCSMLCMHQGLRSIWCSSFTQQHSLFGFPFLRINCITHWPATCCKINLSML